jgi:hypothetical protein
MSERSLQIVRLGNFHENHGPLDRINFTRRPSDDDIARYGSGLILMQIVSQDHCP